MRVRTAIVAAALTASAVVAVPASGFDLRAPADPADRPDPASLPSVASGARPGPEVLYSARPQAPQLENRHPSFVAEPLLVSGEEAYLDGEYLYQDHVYDDYGADVDGSGGSALSARTGDVDYPDDRARYLGNAADLVELRISVREPDVVRYRFTLNAMQAADAAMVALAFDTDGDATTGASELPRHPGLAFEGIDQVLTTWGTGAEWSVLDGDAAATTAVPVHADVEANQLTVTVPRDVADPSGTWRAVLAVGLHDPATGGWLQPEGAPNAVYNLGFRFDEPVLAENTPPDTAQAAALAAGDGMAFAHDIDFGALAAGDDRSTVPAHGTQVWLFPSRLDLGGGRDLDASPAYLGQLQPYSVYVPKAHDGRRRLGLTLALHSLGQQHWQYNGSTGVQQIGEGRGNVVVTPLGRGPDGWYQEEAEYDVFEVWNDLARRLPLDPERVVVSGYSMGGYGTYRLGGLYPDLFGKAFSVVGPPGDGIWLPPGPPTGGIETLSNLWLANTRNLPYLNVVAGADELVPWVGPRAQNLGAPELGIDGFEQLGHRYRFVTYPAAEHFTLALLGYDIPMAPAFLGDGLVDRNPHHVTFRYLPATDVPELGLVHDHAYWVSGVRLADGVTGTDDAPAAATVDVVSHAFGRGEPAVVDHADAGVGPLPWTEVGQLWTEPPAAPAQNRLTLSLTDAGEVRIDAARARLDPRAELLLDVTSTHDAVVHLDGRFTGRHRVLVDGRPLAGATRTDRGLSIPVPAGTTTVVVRPGR